MESLFVSFSLISFQMKFIYTHTYIYVIYARNISGYCPVHMFQCAIYCPPATIDLMYSQTVGGCRTDDQCSLDEKCCAPACGCVNKCVKALSSPSWTNYF